MKQLQQFKNDKERICDKPDCQSLIEVGELAVVQIKPKYFGGNKYFHLRCRPE